MKIQDAIELLELRKIQEVCWGKCSLLTKCVANSTNELPSISEFILLLNGSYEDCEWHPGKEVSINASRVRSDGIVERLNNIAVHEAGNLYNQGYTLCFGDVSEFSSALNILKNSAISYFGGHDKVLITCYLTPPRSTGLLHYDRQHNFFIQCEGHKNWIVSERAAVESPYDNLVYPGATKDFFDTMDRQGYQILKPSQCGKIAYDMHPNDILYVPPGFYHVAETEDQPSLHFTLTLEPFSFWSEINPYLFKTLVSNCGNMNKDIRTLSIDEAMQHFEDCIRELKCSLSKGLSEELLKG